MDKTLYDHDFQQWLSQTVQQLQNRQFEGLDIEHLIEELTELGRSEKNALKSNLTILLAHLLKLRVQSTAPDSMQRSWYSSVIKYSSVIEHRQRVLDSLESTPSLKTFLVEAMEQAYPNARKIAIKEGKLAKFGISTPSGADYPLSCPFSIQEILDEDFYGG